VKLNLGCGGDRKSGFVNVDIAGGDAVCDLRGGIPSNVATTDSVDYIYTSHFLEHIYDEEVIRLLKSCNEVLRQGGSIRICLPDFRKLVKAYLDGDSEFFSLLPGDVKSPLSYLEYCAYQYTSGVADHKALYDFQKIKRMLTAAGFVNIRECQFDPSVDVDTEDRRRYSLYVEAQKRLSYPTFMGGKNVLFALTVHDRIPELRLQEALIRNEFGKTVGIHVFCNCPESDVWMYKDLLEDDFHWCQNTGHAQGSIDHPNMVVDVVDAFDYVILMAAKTIWTDYSLISRVINEMIASKKEIAVFNDDGAGHFKDPGHYGFFCDFMVFSSEMYKKVFPVSLSSNDFPEMVITKKVFELIGSKDNVYYIPCTAPSNAVNDFIFRNIYGTGHEAISTRELDPKLVQLSHKNPRYKNIFDHLLRQR
jgi:predicted SAM-dependent methyltransferase